FGDGAGAVVIGRVEGTGSATGSTPGILASDLGGAPSALGVIETPIGGQFIEMDGQELFRRATRAIVGSAKAALDRAGATPADVDLFVPHQANARIIAAAANRLGLTDEQVLLDVAEHGNTSAASIPLALAT